MTKTDTVKMIVETLCVAQARIGLVDDPRNREHIDRLQRLMDKYEGSGVRLPTSRGVEWPTPQANRHHPDIPREDEEGTGE